MIELLYELILVITLMRINFYKTSACTTVYHAGFIMPVYCTVCRCIKLSNLTTIETIGQCIIEIKLY